jgi:hypothetical protein
MGSFSEKYGYKKIKSVIQIESMDDDLRNSIWNALCIYYFDQMKNPYLSMETAYHQMLVKSIWLNYFKLPIDTISNDTQIVKLILRGHYFKCKWNEVYDFIQFVTSSFFLKSTNKDFIIACNNIFQREMSGYRFISTEIAPITKEEELSEVEQALNSSSSNEPITIHLKSAIKYFSDRKAPDYRNSIKEAISAVEAVCNLITGKKNSTLADALKKIGDIIEIHQALKDSFIKLYGYTNDDQGIRHALMNELKLDSEDAKFMLISCSAFINYLRVKADKAGIKV